MFMKHSIALFILFFVSISAFAVEKDYGYKIDKFVYEAQVHADNSWTVTETISVDFLEERHGIYQYIVEFFSVNHDGQKYVYTTGLDNIEVVGGKTEIKSEDDYTVVRIGDEDRTFTGPKTYVITYTLNYYDDRYEGNDLLFHTILGNNWTTDIEDYEYKITFDNELPAAFADSLKIYSGPYGKEENLCNVTSEVNVAEHSISGHASNVAYGNGITLWAPLPQGYWKGAKTADPQKPMILFGITTAMFLFALVKLIRNRRRRPLMVIEYNAPDNISSAEVGYIIDNTADVSDLTSLIVWWASKGYLKIQENVTEEKVLFFKNKETRITLIKLCDLPETAPAYQRNFWDVFFDKSDTCCINDLGDRHASINSALVALQKSFTGARKLIEFNTGLFILVLLFVLCGAATFAMSSSVMPFYSEMTGLGLVWSIAMIIIYVKRINQTKKDLAITKSKKMLYFTGVAAVFAFFTIGMIGLYEPCNMLLPLSAIIAIFVEAVVLVFFISAVISDTDYRMSQMSLLLGFKEFIRCSELPMLKAMVDENPNYFYDVLPYAMVFGLSDKWQEQFKTLELQPPTWYVNDSLYGNNISPMTGLMAVNSLNKSFNDVISKSIAASSIDPTASSSSSGGGGGFSGGGGGGGGGGSW